MRSNVSSNSKLIQILKMVAPGTDLREGLDYILKARTRSFNSN